MRRIKPIVISILNCSRSGVLNGGIRKVGIVDLLDVAKMAYINRIRDGVRGALKAFKIILFNS